MLVVKIADLQAHYVAQSDALCEGMFSSSALTIRLQCNNNARIASTDKGSFGWISLVKLEKLCRAAISASVAEFHTLILYLGFYISSGEDLKLYCVCVCV